MTLSIVVPDTAIAKLCGIYLTTAASGKTNRFRLNRGGNRQANAALYRVAIVRIRAAAAQHWGEKTLYLLAAF